jgi:antitoxin component YwqK of YwqJK toxin-antitoxin module
MGLPFASFLLLAATHCCGSSLAAQDCPLPSYVRNLKEPDYDELRIRCMFDTLRDFEGHPRSIEIRVADYDEYLHSDPAAWRKLPDSLFNYGERRVFRFDMSGRPTFFMNNYSSEWVNDADTIIYGEYGPVKLIQQLFNMTSTWEYDTKGRLVRKDAFMNGFRTGWVTYAYTTDGKLTLITSAGQHSPDTSRIEYSYAPNGVIVEAAELNNGKPSILWHRPIAYVDSTLAYYITNDSVKAHSVVRTPIGTNALETRWYTDGRLTSRQEERDGRPVRISGSMTSQTFHYDDRGRLLRVDSDVMREDLSGETEMFWEDLMVVDYVYEYQDDDRGNPKRIVVWSFHHGADRRMAVGEPRIHAMWVLHYSYY